MNQRPNLRGVPPQLRQQAQEGFDEGDAMKLLMTVGSQARLALVVDNLGALRARGIYEPCLLDALTGCKTNYHGWSVNVLETLIRIADKQRLRESGDPVPEQPTFRIYRGIAGVGRSRRPHGFSWTLSLDVACWFATRFSLPQPTVKTAEVSRDAVLAYTNDRNEEEVIVRPETVKPVPLSGEEMTERARQRGVWVKASNAALLAKKELLRPRRLSTV